MKIVYCIVVTYNGIKWVNKCFLSLRNADYLIKTIVVDNGSTDGTQHAIISEFPEVEIIQSTTNLGFGKANNIGIKKALKEGADYVFLLNQDAYLFKGSFKSLIQAFENEPSAGILSPIQLAGDERNLDSGFRRCVEPLCMPDFLKDFQNNKLDTLYELEFVNAASWVIKSDVFKSIGLFHPIFDHYGEDNEYIYRLRLNNLKLFIYTNCIIVHDRPQLDKVYKKDEKYAMKQKQGMLAKYCMGKMSIGHIHIKYFAILLYSLLTLRIKHFKIILRNWKDIKKKISNISDYSYDLQK